MESPLYTNALTLTSSATVSARGFRSGLRDSPVQRAVFTFAELPRLRRFQPHHAREITASPWSVGGETLDRGFASFTNYQAWIGSLGAKRIRQQAGWARFERSLGVYDWAWLDECVDGALAQSVQPWLQTSYGNPLYPGGGGTNLGAGLPTSTIALEAWDRWVGALVDRYRDRVNEWEVWNEPDHRGIPAEDYAAFYIRTAEIIRQRQPAAQVYALALAGLGTNYLNTFLNRLQVANKLHLVTAVTAHGYAANPDTLQAGFVQLRQTIQNYSGDIGLRQGESGCPSQPGGFGALSGLPWTELTQANWNLRRLRGDLGHDLPSSLFTLMDLKYPTGWNNKGLLKANPDLTVAYAKPAYYAAQHVMTLFDASLVRLTNFTFQSDAAVPLRGYGYRQTGTGHSLVTVWFSGNTPSDANALTLVNFTFAPVAFHDPVWVDLREGVVRAIPAATWSKDGASCSFTNLPVYDSPVVIAERALIPLATPRQEWWRRHFSVPEQQDAAISGDEADPDGDGVGNFREYLFGMHPRLNDATGLPRAEICAGRLTLRFNWSTTAPDYAYELAGSPDLAAWLTNAPAVESEVLTEQPGFRTIEARLNPPGERTPMGFLWLRAVGQP